MEGPWTVSVEPRMILARLSSEQLRDPLLTLNSIALYLIGKILVPVAMR